MAERSVLWRNGLYTDFRECTYKKNQRPRFTQGRQSSLASLARSSSTKQIHPITQISVSTPLIYSNSLVKGVFAKVP
jgi:hypothetical protein